MSKFDKKFDEIGQRVSAEAGKVKCSKRDYKDGLETIICHLEGCLEAVREELREEEGDE